MIQKLVAIRVELDQDIDVELNRWADKEGRSKRRHLSILARRLTELYGDHRDDLIRLGLVGPAAAN